MIEHTAQTAIPIVGKTMNYDWGIRGKSSLVAQLHSLNTGEVIEDETQAYAELWMGTHPNGPATVKGTQTHLKERLGKGNG